MTVNGNKCKVMAKNADPRFEWPQYKAYALAEKP